MSILTWGGTGTRKFETGVDHGVLYIPNAQGAYASGVAWSGLTTVTESPSGAEASPQYADNRKYLNLVSAEDFGATIEAFSFPLEFLQFDGTASPTKGLSIGQQPRKPFGFSFRTKVGDDVKGAEAGFKLHLIYGALAAPSEKAYATVNDSPEAMTFSWELSTTSVDVPGYSPTAIITVDSTQVTAAQYKALEDILIGTAGTDPRLPLPAEVLGIFAGGSITVVTPDMPAYNATTKVITIPTTTGVVYQIDGKTVSGTVTITKDTIVTAVPAAGYTFAAVSDDDWFYKFS